MQKKGALFMIDLSNVEAYHESNRIEAKKSLGGLPKPSGKPIPSSPTRKAASSCWALKNIRTAPCIRWTCPTLTH